MLGYFHDEWRNTRTLVPSHVSGQKRSPKCSMAWSHTVQVHCELASNYFTEAFSFQRFALNSRDMVWNCTNGLGAYLSLDRPHQWAQYWVLDMQHINRHRSQSTSFSQPDWCRLLNAAHFEWAASRRPDPVSQYHSGPARKGDELFSNARNQLLNWHLVSLRCWSQRLADAFS